MNALRAWSSVFDAQATAYEAAGRPIHGRDWLAAALMGRRLQQRRASVAVTSIVGDEHLVELERGPVIVAFPHVGPFEVAAQLMPEGRIVTVVTNDVEHGPARMLQDVYGWDALSIYEPAALARGALQTLRDGNVLVVSADSLPPGHDGVAVEFLGRFVRLPSGPARLAAKTGAVVVPFAAYLAGRGAEVVVRPPLLLSSAMFNDPAPMTQELADETSALICRDPRQWFPPWPLIPAADDVRNALVGCDP